MEKKKPSSELFGGHTKQGLYVPLSEDEQEVLDRLVQMKDVRLIIHGWGVIEQPVLVVGEHRVTVKFRITFKAPAEPTAVHFFDLELRTHQTGITLFRKRMPCTYNEQPLIVQAGLYLDLAWDIALHSMDPRIVRLLKPGALGLTSRRLDKDTRQPTLEGNMKLDGEQRRALATIEAGAAAVRAEDKAEIIQVMKEAGYEVTVREDGTAEAPDVG
ncbi:MAG: hypothetical protein A2Y38_02780 [Spirochaetes bacterium GWB1_59_5]|nr:MAG: hypothetical protein A2Y38_02780 [Spirochaetes bacterium GWB1_59_5]